MVKASIVIEKWHAMDLKAPDWMDIEFFEKILSQAVGPQDIEVSI